MEVWTGAVAGVATEGNELPLADGDVKRRQPRVGDAGFMAVLIAAQGCLDTRGEGLQMTVDGRLARRMSDVDGIAEAIEADGNAGDIAVGNGVDVLALDIAGLDVKTAMKVVRTGFTKIPRQ